MWSAPVEFTAGTVDVAAFSQALVVSEIMYHSTNPTAAEQAVAAAQTPPQAWNDDAFDFIELLNISANSLDLTGLQFTQGVDCLFPPGTILPAGGRILVVQNTLAFTTRYGTGRPVAAAWSANDKLNNGGDTLTLSFGQVATPVFSFPYDDDPLANWPILPDGGGASLVKISPEDIARSPALGENWRSSLTVTPGGDDRVSYAAWHAGLNSPDHDKDGLDDLVEYAMGGSATSAASALLPTATYEEIADAPTPGTYVVLSFSRAQNHDNVQQRVEFSNNLTTWPILGTKMSSTENEDGTRTEVWRSNVPVSAGTRLFGHVRFTVGN